MKTTKILLFILLTFVTAVQAVGNNCLLPHHTPRKFGVVDMRADPSVHFENAGTVTITSVQLSDDDQTSPLYTSIAASTSTGSTPFQVPDIYICEVYFPAIHPKGRINFTSYGSDPSISINVAKNQAYCYVSTYFTPLYSGYFWWEEL